MVDSWAWIEYFKSTAPGIEVSTVLERSQEDIIVSTINIAEVYNAFLRDYPDNDKFAKDSRAAIKQRSYVFDVDEEIAVEYVSIEGIFDEYNKFYNNLFKQQWDSILCKS